MAEARIRGGGREQWLLYCFKEDTGERTELSFASTLLLLSPAPKREKNGRAVFSRPFLLLPLCNRGLSPPFPPLLFLRHLTRRWKEGRNNNNSCCCLKKGTGVGKTSSRKTGCSAVRGSLRSALPLLFRRRLLRMPRKIAFQIEWITGSIQKEPTTGAPSLRQNPDSSGKEPNPLHLSITGLRRDFSLSFRFGSIWRRGRGRRGEDGGFRSLSCGIF